MKGVTVTPNKDGSRTVTREGDGARWIERDLGPNRVERVYLHSPSRISYSQSASVTVTDDRTPKKHTKRSGHSTIARASGRYSPIRTCSGTPTRPTEIVISRKAYSDISGAFMWTTARDGLEAGVFLRGVALGDQVVISSATRNETVRRSARQAEFDLNAAKSIELFTRWGVGHPEVGIAHTHTDRDWMPSEADFTAWESGFRATSTEDWLDLYAGLIITASERGWSRPEFFGWTTRKENGRLVTEPADVVFA